MIRNTIRFLLTASLLFGANSLSASAKKPTSHSQLGSIPTDGLGVSEMLLIADKSHSLLFLNNPKIKAVKVLEVTDSSKPIEQKDFNYETKGQTQPFHLIEHASELIDFASAGKDTIRHPHTISLVDVSGKVDRHGAVSVKGMCDYITDPHRAVTYALCEHNLTVIRTSAEDDAGEQLWESTLSP